MSRICMVFVLAIAYLQCSSQSLVLSQNNQSSYRIIIPAQPSYVEQSAAAEFRKYFLAATGANLSIEKEGQSNPATAIYIGLTNKTKQQNITDGVADDGFAIKVRDKAVFIAGKEKKGTLYGVYSFLENFLHISCLAPGAVDIPKTTQLKLPAQVNITENPGFKIRENFSSVAYDDLYMNWHKITHIMNNKDTDWGLFGHSVFWLVPFQTYFKDHPEYYSFVNNKRTPSQLCLSNKDVLKLVIDGLKKRMAQKPNAEYWMVGQQDEGTFCQCNLCQAAYKKYGAKSGLLLEFINEVAKAFPDKTIATFAYQETMQPPVGIKPLSNVLIVYAPSKATHQLGFAKNPQNKVYASYMQEWGRLTNNNLFVWDYYANYLDVLAPYPNLQTFSENFRFYTNSGVRYVLAQGINQAGGDMKELKTYVLSKLLWAPDIDQDSLVNDFCKKFYGPAASPVMSYVTALQSNLFKENTTLKLMGDALTYSSGYLKPEYLKQYSQILQQAENAVSNNPVLLARVRAVQLSVDYVILKSNNQATGGGTVARLFSSQSRGAQPGYDINQIKQRFSQQVKTAGIQYLKDSNQEPVNRFLQNVK